MGKNKELVSLEDVMNVMPVGIMLIDQDGLVLGSNHQMATLLGVTTKGLNDRSINDLLPQSAREVMSVVRSRRQAAGFFFSELDGCFGQARPLPRDRSIWAISVFDQRLWQAYFGDGPTLDPLTPYYKQIFESSSDGISIVDSQGRLILVNEASARGHVGVSREELQGRHVSSMVEHGLADGYVSMEVIRGKKPVTRIVKYPKTGKHIFLTGTPIFNAEGQVYLVVVNERDLTAMLKLQTTLKQQKGMLARLKDELRTLQLAELAEHAMVAQSPAMRLTVETALKLSRYGVPQILISGESGTGKGLLAKFVHANSPHASEPFIHINCAALPETLLEAELFGYERGAFTGADPEGRAGLFEAAGRGTAFLDEISEMPLAIQAKILTFLDNREFRRLAGRRTLTAACTVIAATNQDLEQMVAQKKFRQDLYYRLNAFHLHLTPLRERPEDIVELAHREVKKQNARYGLKRELDQESLEILARASFPGNIRQLVNCLNQAVLLSDSPSLAAHLRQTLAAEGARRGLAASADFGATPPKPLNAGRPTSGAVTAKLSENLAETERAGLADALSRCRTTREMAALLGISQAGVSRKLRKHGLNPPKPRRKASPD